MLLKMLLMFIGLVFVPIAWIIGVNIIGNYENTKAKIMTLCLLAVFAVYTYSIFA